MKENPTSNEPKKEGTNDENLKPSDDSKGPEKPDESNKPISEEEGLNFAKRVFKSEKTQDEELNSDEEKEFFKYLKDRQKYRQKVKALGLDDSPTIYYGGIHINDSTVENHGNLVGNDQNSHTNTNTGGFSGQATEKAEDTPEDTASIESVFDKAEDIKQRSFMIALATLNGYNYRIVIESTQHLQSILKRLEENEVEA